MAAPDLEREYNNRLRIPDHAAIFAGWARDAAAYRAERAAAGRAELDLSYGPGARQVVDVFLPDADDGRSLAVFIHGGYWQLFEPAMFSHMARGPNARGVPMAILGYTLAPEASLAAIVAETRSACQFLWRRFGRRPVVTGHSAGGHLTACMVATDWRAAGAVPPDLVTRGIAISGVFELEPLLETTINDRLGLDRETAERLSPLRWSPPAGAVIDAVVGGAESDAFRRQSRDFATAWGGRGAATRYAEIAGAHHFGVIEPLTRPESPLVGRLVELGLT